MKVRESSRRTSQGEVPVSEKRLRAIDTELSAQGCGDGSCAIARPSGMHTNGGCHCIGQRFTEWTPELRRKILIAFALYREKVRLLEGACSRPNGCV